MGQKEQQELSTMTGYQKENPSEATRLTRFKNTWSQGPKDSIIYKI